MMNASVLAFPEQKLYSLPETISWRDEDTGCTIVLAQPDSEPELWEDYLQGALNSYAKHGVEAALDIDSFRDGRDTTLFYTALDDNGKMLGGLRAKGPYLLADESHAIVEWDGQPGQDAVRKMITDRLPFGVVEMKSAWVSDDPARSGELTRTFARTAFPTMTLLGAQFILATAAAHVLDRWSTSGGVVATKIPAAAYPSDRYRTKMMWWDRRTFANHAEPGQLAKIVKEMRMLATLSDEFSGFGMQYGSGM
ncbi:hypothetical protein [Mycolicibacterium aichiense]|uniref:Uncharacterized protein n=1 Tax=Mycolicibacterium aichiense TaxID=1799 RepID=A0AAD1HS88_9MYCO|nr:hypothetical protein [Mycolicibacterium aichiense]BBX10285.1 hypothetical protein MAIC_50880 [Mycolicibacterium aichiense]STZ26055.1 Uncharacterised protein [Mycolicibacterium aichiense]